MSRIFTIGHSTRSADEFVELLAANGIHMLVDVRRYPGSRRFPHFNREALIGLLGAGGIAYQHEPELGGRREGAPDSPNRLWKNPSFRAYADYMSTAEFQSALAQLERYADTGTVAIMCAEAVPWRCHRQLIADALVARGHEVRHILSGKRVAAHELNAGAVVGPSGSVIYPGPADAQSSLFTSEE